MNLPKIDDNDRTHENDANTTLGIWSMLPSGQVPHTSNTSHLFENLEGSVLVQTLSCRRKRTYHPLLIGFSHHLISMQNVGHNIL